MGKPNDFAVVGWDRPNGKQEVEAISTKKVVLQGKADVGVAVEMQYKGEIWKGNILSFHDAKDALARELNSSGDEDGIDESEDEENCQPSPHSSQKSRKRTKNKRLDGFETILEDSDSDSPSKKQKPSGGEKKGEKPKKNDKGNNDAKKIKAKKNAAQKKREDGDSDSPSKKKKPSGGKKKGDGAKKNDKENTDAKKVKAKENAAEKERKRIERDRVNQEKEKERKALAERNNLLLEQMTALVGRSRSEGDSFTSDVVTESVDLTSPWTPPNPTHQLQKTIAELQSVTPRQEVTIAHLQRTLATLQGNSIVPMPITESHQPLSQLPPATSTPVTPQVQRLTPLADTPIINTAVPRQVRPTFGGKCPRRNLPLQSPASSDDDEVCASCTQLKQRVRELEDQLKSLQGQVSDPPRPGRISPILADRFKMVELTPGSQVFIYQDLIQQAIAKPSFKAAASFLLNCFYTNDELVGMNLSGANERPHPDKAILESIIGFVMKEDAESRPSPSAIKIALRNKLNALQSRQSKKAQQQ